MNLKNITLSIPEELLSKSREYAASHGKSLNGMIREMLSKAVSTSKPDYNQISKELEVDTKLTFTRDELYER